MNSKVEAILVKLQDDLQAAKQNALVNSAFMGGSMRDDQLATASACEDRLVEIDAALGEIKAMRLRLSSLAEGIGFLLTDRYSQRPLPDDCNVNVGVRWLKEAYRAATEYAGLTPGGI